MKELLAGKYADKLLHFFVAYFISSLFTSTDVGFVVAFSLAVIKELFDWIVRKTKFDPEDLMFSVLGALAWVVNVMYL